MSGQQGTFALIQGDYRIDGTMPLPGAGGGLPAFAAIEQRLGQREAMAVQAAALAPARHKAISALAGVAIPQLLVPLGHGGGEGAPSCADGSPALYVVCPRPPGPALDTAPPGARPWREGELLDCVVRPIASVLVRLADHRITHRAIRPNNVFQSRLGVPVTLGCAWAAPPASLQPAAFEPPESAMCLSHGRGDGTVADDVYALGVLLITLATGQVPLAGLPDAEIIRRKLEQGSFAALTEGLRLPLTLVDLLRGMLAEDPSHRPAPSLLVDPMAARARRVSARAPARAQHPIDVDGLLAWNRRGLAFALSRASDPTALLQRGFGLDPWLRRNLGDPVLAGRLDDVVRPATREPARDRVGSDIMVMQAISVLDPLAPLCWRGASFFPDALGPVLAAHSPAGEGAGPDDAAGLADLVRSHAIESWIDQHPERPDAASLQSESHLNRLALRMPGWAGGLARLRSALNPLLPCRSPLLGSACVIRLSELLPAIERAIAVRPDRMPEQVLDAPIGAFIAAQLSGRADADLAELALPDAPAASRGLAQLRILAMLQGRQPGLALPMVAQAARPAAEPALEAWRSRSLRAARAAALTEASQRGDLVAMLQTLEDPDARAKDTKAALAAEAERMELDRSLKALQLEAELHPVHARLEGSQIAGAVGMMALITALMLAVLS